MDFIRACEEGKAAEAKAMLARGADPNAADRSGTTALMLAAAAGGAELVAALLRAGAGVNRQDKWGQTALMLAAGRGRLEAIKILLKAGAVHGGTAADFAKENGHAQLAKLL